MAPTEFKTEITFSAADYQAMASAVAAGAAAQLEQTMGRAQSRVLSRLVLSVLKSITVADVGTTVTYTGREWLVAGTLHAGRVGEIVVLDDPSKAFASIVVTGDDIEAITAPDGAQLLWLIEPTTEADIDVDDVPLTPSPDVLPES